MVEADIKKCQHKGSFPRYCAKNFNEDIHMKKLTLILAALLLATGAHAENAFDGINFQIGMGLSGTQMAATGTQDTTLTPNPNLNGDSNGNSANGLTSLGYSYSVSSFNMAANAFYVIGNQSAGSPSYSGTSNSGTSETLSATYKLKNTWGLSVEPGLYFDDKTLGFLKLAYVQSNMQASMYCDASDLACSNLSIGPFTGTLRGFGYGLGVKHMFDKNFYGALDVLGVSYNSMNRTYSWLSTINTNNDSNFKPSQWMGFVSVGYKF